MIFFQLLNFFHLSIFLRLRAIWPKAIWPTAIWSTQYKNRLVGQSTVKLTEGAASLVQNAFSATRFLCNALFVQCAFCAMRFLCKALFVQRAFCATRFSCDYYTG
jgi:hypothetical protein